MIADTNTILARVYTELKDLPMVKEDFFQMAAGARSHKEFIDIVMEFAPSALDD